MTNIESTLVERESRYGVFAVHARITQGIKRAMSDSPNWASLRDDQRECLEMLAHKIGRILNGDPDYHDSWHDIEGYTRLVAETLAPTDAEPSYTRSEIIEALEHFERMIGSDHFPDATEMVDELTYAESSSAKRANDQFLENDDAEVCA